jgi:ATP-dependent protease ClpP protease subunit
VNDQVQQHQTQHIVILISSPGGDTTAAFAAYNVLRNVKADITTFNIGHVDSAAMLLFCAGKDMLYKELDF